METEETLKTLLADVLTCIITKLPPKEANKLSQAVLESANDIQQIVSVHLKVRDRLVEGTDVLH